MQAREELKELQTEDKDVDKDGDKDVEGRT